MTLGQGVAVYCYISMDLARDEFGPVTRRTWNQYMARKTFPSVVKEEWKTENRGEAHAPKPQETAPQSYPSASDAFSISGVLIP